MLFEPPDGGVAAHVAQLAQGLPAHGWRVTVAGPPTAAIREGLQAEGVAYVSLPSLRRGYGDPGADARARREIGGLVRGGDFAVVHCHSSKAGLLGRTARAPHGTAVVYSPHCFGFVGDVSPLRRALTVRVERALTRRTDAVICVSEAELRRARTHGIGAPDRLCHVDNGVATVLPGPPDPEMLAFRGDGLLVGAVTVLREQKRIDVLLDAAVDVLDRAPRARFAIVGDGPLRDDLVEHARRLGLLETGRVRFFAFGGTSLPHLRALDVYVLPSAWEAMPIGTLEALAAGVPQVVSDVDGLGEIVTDDTGIRVPPKDPRALADALVSLLCDGPRRARASAASRRQRTLRFDADRMVRETAQVYDRCLRRRGAEDRAAA